MKPARLVALFAALAIVAAACTGDDEGEGTTGGGETGTTGPQEEVTLQWWTLSEDVGVFEDELVTAFEAAHPNIKVEVTTYPEGNFGVKVDTAIAAGKPPDVVSYPGLQWMKEGLLVPLDDMVAEEGIDLSGFNPAIVGTSEQTNAEFGCAYDGKLYCLGSFLGSVVLLYNKDMFDAAGIAYPPTWPPMSVDTFVEDSCALTDEENGVWGSAYGDPVTWLPWETFVSSDGLTVTGYVNGPESVHVHEVLARGVLDGCAPSLNMMDPWEQGQDFFADGKLAMVVGGFQGLEQLEDAGINYGVSGLPTPEGVEPFFNTWSDGMAIFASSPYQEEAKQLVAFLATEGQLIRAQAGDFPLDATVAEETGWTQGIPGREEGVEVLPHARGAVFIPNRWDTFGPIFDAFGFITAGDKTAQEALDDAEPPLQENLDKAWRLWNQD